MLYTKQLKCYNYDMETKLDVVNFQNEEFYFLFVQRRVGKGITGRSYHNHSFYEIMFIADGESEYAIENKRYLLKGGDALLINPYRHHLEYNRIIEKSSLYCIGFFADAISNGDLAERIFERGEHISLGNDSPFEKLLLAAKAKLSKNQDNAPGYMKSLTEALIFSLDDHGYGKQVRPEIKNAVVEKTLDFINASLCSISSLDNISEALFFSKAYIRAVFKKEMGIGIMEYVRNRKVIRAHERISGGEKPTEIYTECGFSTYSSFYRAYVSYFGYPPKTKKK